MVGAAGFEPATLWSQTRCATRLRYTPINGAESGARTRNLHVGNVMLYQLSYFRITLGKKAGAAGLEPATFRVTTERTANYATPHLSSP